MQKLRIILGIVLAVLISGCETTYTIQSNSTPFEDNQATDCPKRRIALFLDGTSNDVDSRTNIARLSEIVRNQDTKNLHVFYNEGVGTDYRVIGGGTGWGIDKDVAEAYAFLTYAYKENSDLYLFGFSRGAYTARVLAGMIYSVGIYDFSDKPEAERIKLSRALYNDYKDTKKIKYDDFSSHIPSECAIPKRELDGQRGGQESLYADECEIATKANDRIGRNAEYRNVSIKVLGLWDTVEALGFVPTIKAIGRNFLGISEEINVVDPNNHYIDQICNVEHVFHALALDDNRQYVFTPITIKSPNVVARCKDEQGGERLARVQEVWFSGAHADVGGGYKPLEQIDKNYVGYVDLGLQGVSLNWMINKITEINAEKSKVGDSLIPPGAGVYQNILGYSHNAENGSLLYECGERSDVFKKYQKVYDSLSGVDELYVPDQAVPALGKLSVHHSAIDRVTSKDFLKGKNQDPPTSQDYGFDSKWYHMEPFKSCFTLVKAKTSKESDRLVFDKKCKFINYVE